jgi:hypothetical protein
MKVTSSSHTEIRAAFSSAVTPFFARIDCFTPQDSRAYRFSDSPNLTSQPSVRGIRVHPGMPDHQVLETSKFSGRLQNFDLAVFCFDSCESSRGRQNQLRSRNTPGSRAEIRQCDHGSTAMAMRCEAFLWYMLRTFHDIDANMFGCEILFERDLTLVGRLCRHNANELFLIDHLGL